MEAPSWLKKFSSSTKGKNKRSRSPVEESYDNTKEEIPPKSESRDNLVDEYMGDSVLSVQIPDEPCKVQIKRHIFSKQKPLKEVMHVALEEGLDKPLDKSNLGFKMVRHFLKYF